MKNDAVFCLPKLSAVPDKPIPRPEPELPPVEPSTVPPVDIPPPVPPPIRGWVNETVVIHEMKK